MWQLLTAIIPDQTPLRKHGIHLPAMVDSSIISAEGDGPYLTDLALLFSSISYFLFKNKSCKNTKPLSCKVNAGENVCTAGQWLN